MATVTKTDSTTTPVADPILDARRNIQLALLALEGHKADLIFAVKDSGATHLYDKDAGLYVGPDRHNADWVVQWDAKQARSAATQMVLDGERTCNWQQCECKRPARGTFQARF